MAMNKDFLGHIIASTDSAGGAPVGAPDNSTSTVTAEASPMTERDVMCLDLYKAATSGDTARLLELLNPAAENGVHGPCRLSEVTGGRNTVLHLAAGLGHAGLAEEAFRREPSLLTAENSRGDTPLHCAARAGHSGVISLLLKLAGHGASEVLVKKNQLGDTALHEAVRNGHGEVVENLKIAAPHLASMDNEDGVSPLYLAVMNGSIPLVQSLIRYEHASIAGPDGQTSLHAAVLTNIKITTILLEWKRETAQDVDASFRTPLHYAASGDDTKIVEMLLDASTSATYSRDSDGFSPIHVAARVGNVETIKLLLKTCPDSGELLDNRGRNFLHLAVENRKIKVVQYVLKHGKEFEKLINEQDFEGNTPLHLAVESESAQIVVALMRDGKIQKSIMNKQGRTPLELASKITGLLPSALIVIGLAYSGASFSVRSRDKVEPWKGVGRNWYMDVSQNLAIVSALIATVAFSATFNVPGGYKSDDDGRPVLYGKPKFKRFMAFDSMAMGFSLVSIILFVLVRAVDSHARWLLIAGIFTMWLAIDFMSLAFMVAAMYAGFAYISTIVYLIFYSPVLYITFFEHNSMSTVIFRRISRLLRPISYSQGRVKQQFNDAQFLVTGFAVVLVLSYVSAILLIAFTRYL